MPNRSLERTGDSQQQGQKANKLGPLESKWGADPGRSACTHPYLKIGTY